MSSRRLLQQIAVVLGLALLIVQQGAQAAAPGGGDMVVGGGVFEGGTNFAVSARSGPLGENPQGLFTFVIYVAGFGAGQGQAAVTCLAVAANLAAVGVVVTGGDVFPVGTQIVATIRDGGPGQSGDGISFVEAPAELCPTFVESAAAAPPIEAGSLLVHDEQAQ